MAEILVNLFWGRMTSTIAKRLLALVLDRDERAVNDIIVEEDLDLRPMSQAECLVIA